MLYTIYTMAKKSIKIRIGYVLKSADVGTLFSSRYSEKSSHTHTRRHPRTSAHTSEHHCTLAHTCAHPPTLRTPAYTCAHPCIPTHTRTHPRASMHTRPHPQRTLRAPVVVIELIIVVVDKFELINHM